MNKLCTFAGALALSATSVFADDSADMTNSEIVMKVFEAVEAGSPSGLDFYSDKEYIQHNLGMPSGKEAVGGFFTGTPTGVTIDNHFIFEDRDIVVTYSTYGGTWGQFVGSNSDQVVMDVFRFKDGLMVEHWDNLTNLSDPVVNEVNGNTQVNGLTEPTNLEDTDANKAFVTDMVNVMLQGGAWSKRDEYFSKDYIQHSPGVPNGTDWMASFEEGFQFYDTLEFVHGSGNYVLAMSQGFEQDDGTRMAYYDIFRIEDGLIAEHWDTQQIIPAAGDQMNANGKW